MITEHQGTPVYYTSAGEGNPLILLHGFLETSQIWKPFVEELSAKRRVICVDLPGHGQTGLFGEVHTMEIMAEMVNNVLEELQIPQATVLGHSMGGYVCLALAEKYPDKISGLILMNSTPAADSEEKRKNRDKAAEAVRKNKKAYINLAINNLVAPGNDKVFKEELQHLKLEAQKSTSKGIIANLMGMKIRTDKQHVLREFKGYRIMISGIDDPIMPNESTKELANSCNCPFITISGGHLSQIENPEKIKELMHFID